MAIKAIARYTECIAHGVMLHLSEETRSKQRMLGTGEQTMSCRECAHLHIVNGRIVYARCLLGKAIFERYGAGRLLPSEHSCEECRVQSEK